MKQLFLINDTTVNKLSYYHLACFLIALPFDFFYSELILISFGLHTLIHFRKENIKNMLTKPVLTLLSIYLLGIATIFYSTDKAEGINIATRQLAIFIIPILFALTDLDLEKYRMNLLVIFGFTCTLLTIYLFVDAVINILDLHLPLSSLFTVSYMNHNFSRPVQMHATYLSLYTTFSLLVFLYILFKQTDLKAKMVIYNCGSDISSRNAAIIFKSSFHCIFDHP